jgi:hypothetical protein
MSTDRRAAEDATSCADDVAVDADFVAALAHDYATHGSAAIEALRVANPARYLLMMATVLFDERYAGVFADFDASSSGVA